jgi:GT2 family glycosyltransferase
VTDIAVIIIGLNASRYVQECLTSLRRADWGRWTYEVIYVDNGSTDDTLAALETLYSDVKVIANPTNLGFCKAGNQGAAACDSNYYFFLNDDTLVEGYAVGMLADLFAKVPNLGVAISRLIFPDRTEQYSGRRFPSLANGFLGRRSILTRLVPNHKAVKRYLYKDELKQNEPFAIEWGSAAAMMFDRETFHSVGGFAEDYYYWHEAVICDRVKRSGKVIYLHPESVVIHHEGKGSGSRPFAVRKWHIVDFHRAAYRCYCEHFELSRMSVRRWFAALALLTRAASLLAATRIATWRLKSEASR